MTHPQFHQPASRLRIATWNVETLTGRLTEAIAFMVAHRIHVLCMQEVRITVHSAPALVKWAAKEGFHLRICSYWSHNDQRTGGVAVLTALPIRSCDNLGAGQHPCDEHYDFFQFSPSTVWAHCQDPGPEIADFSLGGRREIE